MCVLYVVNSFDYLPEKKHRRKLFKKFHDLECLLLGWISSGLQFFFSLEILTLLLYCLHFPDLLVRSHMLFGLLNIFCYLLFSPVENFSIFHYFQFSEISQCYGLVWVFFHIFIGYTLSGNSCSWFSSGKFTWIILFILGCILYDVWNYLKMSFLVSLWLWNFCSLILWYFLLVRILCCFAYAFYWFHGCSVLLCWGCHVFLPHSFLIFFFFSWVALFPSSSFVFCFSLCLLSKGFFFQMFGDSWVSVYLITGLSKSSWKPCVCFLWAFLHSNLARVFHWRVPSWFSNTILHRDESATVPVRYRVVCEHWGKEGWYLTIQ